MIPIKTKEEINGIEKSCKIAADILKELIKATKPGTKTIYLDEIATDLAAKKKAKLAFKGYRNFPKGICVSINDEVVHGIPSQRIINNGDIVSIDIGILFNGFYADTAFTVGVNEINGTLKKLIEVTETSLHRGIEKAKAESRLFDISSAIQSYVEMNGFSVVRDLVGHGIGKNLHEEPMVPNFGKPNTGPRLENGMVLAIEPMVCQGKWQVEILENKWTVVTKDHSFAAHFEHTVAILPDGPRILTKI